MKHLKWIGFIVSAFFIFLAIRNFNFNEFIKAIQKLDYFYLLVAAMVYSSSFFIRGMRWQLILKSVKQVSFFNSYSTTVIGFMANCLLPLRLGEIVRAYIIGKKETISKSTSLSSILLERVFDGISILFLLFILIFTIHLPEYIIYLSLISSFIFVATALFLYAITFKIINIYNIIINNKYLSFISPNSKLKIVHIIDNLIFGLTLLKNRKRTLSVFYFSIIIWIIETIVYFLSLMSFGIKIPFYGIILTVIIVNIGIMIPSSPGNAGTFNYFVILALSFFNIESNLALAYSIVLFTLMYIMVVVPGIILLWKMGFSMDDIQKPRTDIL